MLGRKPTDYPVQLCLIMMLRSILCRVQLSKEILFALLLALCTDLFVSLRKCSKAAPAVESELLHNRKEGKLSTFPFQSKTVICAALAC